MTKQHVKDTPLGILVILVSGLLFYLAWVESNFVPLLDFCLILLFSWVGRIIFQMGVIFIRGVDVDIS